MSQGGRTLHELGSLRLLKDTRLSLGSSSEVTPLVVPAPVTLTDADATVTVDDVKSGLFVQTPTVSRTTTLPTAALLASFLKKVGDSVDLVVINLGADTIDSVIAAGSGGSIVGSAVVKDSDPTTASASGSAVFRIRQTNVSSGTEAYVCYRVC